MKARGYAFAGVGAGLAVALIAYLAFRADSGVVPSNHAGEAVLGEEREALARTDGALVVDAQGARATAPFQVEVIRVTTVFGPDKRPLAGSRPLIASGVKRGEAPGPVVEFNRWLERYSAATPQQRGGMLAEGEALLRARRARWIEFARENPEAAILLSPSEEKRALLPGEFLKSLEKPVAGEGFYGVRASCGHGPDGGHTAPCEIAYDVIIDGRVLEAAIYGSRRQRLTEENASIYGVELDGLIALHEDDVVVRRAAAGGFFITHKGTSAVIADLVGIEERLAVFSTP